ncbi:MAG TPA: tyrosine-type recombinase/integrase [Sphingobacterium sp.]|nr:tyrosine-type recombinase/integrase [Sphingobacterium sp.]
MEIIKKAIIWTYRSIKRSKLNYRIGEHEIRIRLTQVKDIEYLSTGYSSTLANWDEENDCPATSHPFHKEITKKLEELTKKVDIEIALAERERRVITPLEIKQKIERKTLSKKLKERPQKILAYLDYIIDSLEEEGNTGYADVFINCKATVSKLLKKQDKHFLSFTKELHEEYERQISRGTTESTISLYLRTYYRVWNLAIKDGICSKNHHPSQYIKFKAYKRIRTKKRAIKADHLQRIFKLKLPLESRLYRSQKIIQFLYYSRGMNFNDVCKLKKEALANNGIFYRRSKNKREYNFELHKKAIEIITIFKNYPMQSDADYVFPFLMSFHDTPRKIDARVDSALKDLNEDFKTMAKAIGWEGCATSYALRHGFASHLRNKGVDIRIIKEAMGHETEEQTQVYLDDIDDTIVALAIDEALA